MSLYIDKKCFRSIKGFKSWHTETIGNCPPRIKVAKTRAYSILRCLNSMTVGSNKVVYTNKWT